MGLHSSAKTEVTPTFGLWAVLKLLRVPWCEGEIEGAYLPKASRGFIVEMCQRFLRAWRAVLEGRPVGSRESENIIPPPSVNFHWSLKNASKNDEHSLGESDLVAKPQLPPLLQHGQHRVKVRLPKLHS